MNMVAVYNVYRRNVDEIPVISLSRLPEIQMRGKKKYTGKKAKIEAVFRLSNEVLPDDWSTRRVNDYIGVSLFGTSKWNGYRSILNEVLDERIVISEKYELQYRLTVTFRNEMKAGNRTVKTDPADERVIHMITKELIGEPLEMYKSVLNPIKSLKKEHSNEPKNT